MLNDSSGLKITKLSTIMQNNMATFCQYVSLAVVLGCTFVLGSFHAPKPCCVSQVFSTGFASFSNQQSYDQFTIATEGNYYFDLPNNRVAENYTITVLDRKDPVTQIYDIADYTKKILYEITDNKTCEKIPLSGDLDKFCIPDNATFQGTVKLGDSYAVNRWLMNYPPEIQEATMTVDKCIPLSLLIVQPDNKFMLSEQFFNFKTSIDNPEEKFTPPSICDKVSLSSTTVSTKKSLTSLFMVQRGSKFVTRKFLTGINSRA